MTNQMNESITVKCKVEDIIAELKFLDVDGETMQHIIQSVGLEDQITRQLVMISDINYLNDLIEEKNTLE